MCFWKQLIQTHATTDIAIQAKYPKDDEETFTTMSDSRNSDIQGRINWEMSISSQSVRKAVWAPLRLLSSMNGKKNPSVFINLLCMPTAFRKFITINLVLPILQAQHLGTLYIYQLVLCLVTECQDLGANLFLVTTLGQQKRPWT